MPPPPKPSSPDSLTASSRPRTDAKSAVRAKKRRRTTVQGRIVYDRPKHELTERDALRILRKVYGLSSGALSFRDFEILLERLSVSMLRQILDKVGLGAVAFQAFNALRSVVRVALEYVFANSYTPEKEKEDLRKWFNK